MSGNDDDDTVPAVEEDLAPCAGTMVVALARAVLKHLSSRDGNNLCSEDLTLLLASKQQMQQQQRQQHHHSLSQDDQLAVALDEVSSPEHPLESRLFAGLSVLSRALDPTCFVALVDPQVLATFRLGARTLALCDLMRQPQENGSKKANEQFTEDELAVVESTIRCYMCISLCALGGWERAQQISEAIRDGDATPFRDANAAKMFKVLVACVGEFQALTLDAIARRAAAVAASGSNPQQQHHQQQLQTGRSTASATDQQQQQQQQQLDSFAVLNNIVATLNHAKRWLLEGKDSSSSSFEHVLALQMIHLTQMATSAAVLTEKAETMVARALDQAAAAERDQRKLFRRMRLSKDPAEVRDIQTTARDVGSAQETELRRSVVALHRIACSLWKVIADCCVVEQDAQPAVDATSKKGGGGEAHRTVQRVPASVVNAGCAVTMAECLRGLLLIRTVPLADRALCDVADLTQPVSRSVAAALGDASPWSLHVKLTAVLVMLRHTELPPPSPIVAWSISPDVLTKRWKPPVELVSRAMEMVAEGGLATKPPPPSSRPKQQQRDKNEDKSDDDPTTTSSSTAVAAADFSSDVMDALMMLDEVTIHRERIVTLGAGSAAARAAAGFDECEYLGGASKVAALIESLERIIQASESGNNNSNNNTAVQLPTLPDSVLAEVRRLRSLVTHKIPVAEAVAAEQQRRRSPRSAGGRSPRSDSPTNKNNNTCGNGSGVKVVRRAKLSIAPSGGVLRNGSSVRFGLSKHYAGLAANGSLELLVSVSHGGGAAGGVESDPSSRVFKVVDPNQRFTINIGKYAPGWAEVHAMLMDPRKAAQEQQRHTNEQVDHHDDESNNDALAKSVLAVCTGRFYVVTHGDIIGSDGKVKVK